MKIDPVEIIDAWAAKFRSKPDSDRTKLARQRLLICNECDKRKTRGISDKIGFSYCGICGCVLSAKVFTKRENACPMSKWKCDHKSPVFNKNLKSLV